MKGTVAIAWREDSVPAPHMPTVERYGGEGGPLNPTAPSDDWRRLAPLDLATAIGELRAALAPADRAQIGKAVTLLVGGFPSGRPVDADTYLGALEFAIADAKVPADLLPELVKEIWRKHVFLPAPAEVIAAAGDVLWRRRATYKRAEMVGSMWDGEIRRIAAAAYWRRRRATVLAQKAAGPVADERVLAWQFDRDHAHEEQELRSAICDWWLDGKSQADVQDLCRKWAEGDPVALEPPAAPGPAASEHVGAAAGINGPRRWRKPTYEIIDLARPARADMETQPAGAARAYSDDC